MDREKVSKIFAISLLFVTNLLLLIPSISAEEITTIVSVETQIAQGNDDAYGVENGSTVLGDSIVQAGEGSRAAYRFQLQIPQNASIKNAHLSLAYNWASHSAVSLLVSAENSDNSPAFNTNLNNIANRKTFNNSIEWTAVKTEWGTYLQSPDLSSQLENLISKSTWKSGNYVTFIVESKNHDQIWEAISYEGSDWDPGTLAAKLSFDTEIVTQQEEPCTSCTEEKLFTSVVTNANDDAYETETGEMQISSEIVDSQKLGAFMFHTNIPQGSVINNAHLSIAYNWGLDNPQVNIFGELGKSANFASTKNDLSKRNKTLNSVAWTLSSTLDWGTYTKSPDISSVLQEQVNNKNWNGTAVIFLENKNDEKFWEAVSYEGSDWSEGALAAMLDVNASVKGEVSKEKGKVMFVVDDLQYDWIEEESVAITQLHITENVDLLVNVIPYGLSKSTLLTPQLLNWSKNYGSLIEIAMHGYTHTGDEYLMDSDSYTRQKQIIESGLAEFTKLGIRPYSFTPPGGAQNTDTLKVLDEEGFHTIFDWWVGQKKINSVYVLKQSEALLCVNADEGSKCKFKSSEQLMTEMDKALAKDGYVAVTFHVQDFMTPTGSLNQTKMTQYKTILEEFKKSSKYEFVTAEEYYQSIK
ncbi:DUF2334 domain-containing protein [Candidatus Woesearchaeota archaeon]|nr:DUF2334 domain-containing protein [Nanoarchaeota archaeon]MCB9370189.1 DUF2334 domain-containing protein [Candidatus Woesearchaeota archaeon]USN44717.1 MAG: DUF2334 domain-containing protein [Candidatus Woesearchaeota archaeon]